MTPHAYDPTKKYDAVIVLSGGLAKTPGGFRSTNYQERDSAGMLGGRMRVLAAHQLLRRGLSERFVFTTGITERNLEQFWGWVVPAECRVYAAEFVDLSRAGSRAMIFVEDQSTTTEGNLRVTFGMAAREGWSNVGILSSNYHLPRVQALAKVVRGQLGFRASTTLISAEAVLMQERPGQYDREIDRAYASDVGLERIRNEDIGVQRITAEEYGPGDNPRPRA